MRHLSASLVSVIALVAIGFTSAGCIVAAAGVVEGSNGRKFNDPMGNDYDGVDGTVGWRADVDGGMDMVGAFTYGTQRLGCNTRHDGGKMAANCPGPEGTVVFAFQQARTVYRLCQRGTPRMTCRMQWERIHDAMRTPAAAGAPGESTVVASPTAGPAPSAPTPAAPPAATTPAPVSTGGDWF